MENERILDINYEEMFKFTDTTPVGVVLSENEFENLCHHLGIYGFGWYFVDEDLIKFYKNKKWSYMKYKVNKVITYGEKYNRRE